MQDNKNESSAANLKLCFLILTCISEDQYANSMMHDSNLTYKVLLHRAPMRHRKLPQVSHAIKYKQCQSYDVCCEHKNHLTFEKYALSICLIVYVFSF